MLLGGGVFQRGLCCSAIGLATVLTITALAQMPMPSALTVPGQPTAISPLIRR